ncbi:thiosulfate sulfurtransferase/rhodanese-like domain-containing protein 1 [Varroa destructor]|uniref:Rhodanese domain-containing protein n=1 Tax=Varroa destructor TaxID=109461 RepID=A0A7M7JT52_VARDE|nr:thiosulfate sulfurtransferase/rhodanese-like domain-containing protein 1 [Varroa destructor]XP_022656502.1 thiosulfate sulfurtransferase/rhodanese-like domain-containing protein 1 [Varroa destructor]XP_022656503.1 thiosulfate sulfurtransferase/rhodanese-like domain-containing protein 1 [Varroa destructor]
MSLSAVIRVAVRAVHPFTRKFTANTPSAVILENHKFGDLSGLRTAMLHRSSVVMTKLEYEDLVALLGGGNLHLVDVREPSEIRETGRIPGAINIPLGQVKQALLLDDEIFQERFRCEKPLKHDTNLIFYGLGPIKSRAAVELARKAGYKSCREYSGGLEDWLKHDGNVERVSS